MSSLLPDHDEHLTTGWEPDLDAGDSIVRAAVLAHASWAIAPARSLGRPWRDGAVWAAGHAADAGSLTNQVVLKQPPTELRTVVAELDDFYPAGVPFVVVSAWPTGDLRALGLGLVGHPPLMLRPASPADVPPSDLELRWAVGADDLVAAERVFVEGYPLLELQPFVPGRLYSPALTDSSTRIVVAFDGDAAVATAAAHSAHGITLVENVAVLPAARGRRAGLAVTAAATMAFPDQPAVLLASDDGQPVYERLGYLRLERWTVWLRPNV